MPEPGKGLPGVPEMKAHAATWEAELMGDPPRVPGGLQREVWAASLVKAAAPEKGSITALVGT